MTIESKEGLEILGIIHSIPSDKSVTSYLSFLKKISTWAINANKKAEAINAILDPLKNAELLALNEKYARVEITKEIKDQINAETDLITEKYKAYALPVSAKKPSQKELTLAEIEEIHQQYPDQITPEEKNEISKIFKQKPIESRIFLSLLNEAINDIQKDIGGGDNQDNLAELYRLKNMFFDLFLKEDDDISAGIIFHNLLQQKEIDTIITPLKEAELLSLELQAVDEEQEKTKPTKEITAELTQKKGLVEKKYKAYFNLESIKDIKTQYSQSEIEEIYQSIKPHERDDSEKNNIEKIFKNSSPLKLHVFISLLNEALHDIKKDPENQKQLHKIIDGFLNDKYITKDYQVSLQEEQDMNAAIHEALGLYLLEVKASDNIEFQKEWLKKSPILAENKDHPNKEYIKLIFGIPRNHVFFLEQLNTLKNQANDLEKRGKKEAANSANKLFNELAEEARAGFSGGAHEILEFQKSLKDRIITIMNSEDELTKHPEILSPFLHTLLNYSISNYESRNAENLKKDKNQQQYLQEAKSLLKNIKNLPTLDAESLQDVGVIVYHCGIILDNNADGKNTRVLESIEELGVQAEKNHSKTSTAWKALGVGLAGFAILSLVVGGLLAAIPVGGTLVIGIAAMLTAIVTSVISAKAIETGAKVKREQNRIPSAVTGFLGVINKEKPHANTEKEKGDDADTTGNIPHKH